MWSLGATASDNYDGDLTGSIVIDATGGGHLHVGQLLGDL